MNEKTKVRYVGWTRKDGQDVYLGYVRDENVPRSTKSNPGDNRATSGAAQNSGSVRGSSPR